MDSTATYILAASLFIIMMGMGLSLTIDDFKRIFVHPKAVSIGILNQIVLLPLIGWILVSSLSLPPIIAVGIMILAASPGGPTSNLFSHLAHGDTALSVSLTAINSIVTIITIPIVVQLALVNFMGDSTEVVLDVPNIVVQLIAITLVPITIGMVLKAKAAEFAEKMARPVRIASAVILALVIIGLVLKEKANILVYFEKAGFAAFLLNVTTMIVGYFSALMFRLSKKQSITISIESGLQNGTLAIAIATVTLGNTELAIAPAIYSLIMFFTCGLIAWIGTKVLDL